jgi:hypothetical protein
MAKAKAAKPQQNQKAAPKQFEPKAHSRGKKAGEALRRQHEIARIEAAHELAGRQILASAARRSSRVDTLKRTAPQVYRVAVAILEVYPTVRPGPGESRFEAAVRVTRARFVLNGDIIPSIHQDSAEDVTKTALAEALKPTKPPAKLPALISTSA